MTGYRSRLYQCVVRHVRDRPTRHVFSYRYFTFCLDLDEIDSLSAQLKLFGTQRSKIYRFQESDYLITRHDSAANKRIKAGVLEYARQNGVIEPIERVELVTNVRVLGYVFNPVVFFYCYSSSGAPVCVIPEVGNTYGEKKLYFLGAEHLKAGAFQSIQTRHFYVSPFVALDAAFEFKLTPPTDRLNIEIHSQRDGSHQVQSYLTGQAAALTDRMLLITLLRYPLVTLKIIFSIHYQAVKLFIKSVPYLRKTDHPEQQKGTLL